MSECLIVRLSSQQNTLIPWVVWSPVQQAVIDSGELANWQQLEQLTSYADQRSTIVLLAASDVLLTQVTIPAGANRQFTSVLPYLLEDDLAQDVDELHFSVLDKQGEQAFIAALDRDWLQSILEHLQALGMTVKRVLPDNLALPINEGGLSAAQIGDQWLIRKGEYHGLGVDQEWLTWFCDSEWVKDQDNYLPLTAYTPLPDLPVHTEQTWQSQPCQSVMSLLAEQVMVNKVNLLTGIFKPKSSWQKYWLIWRKAVIATVMLLAIFVIHYSLQVHQNTVVAQNYRSESERIFRTIFPDKQRIPTISYLKRQMTDELNTLTGGKQGEDVLNWLNQLPATIGSVKAMEIQSLRFDANRGELRIEASSPDFQTFEQARVKLAEHFAVEQGQLSKNDQRVLGSFVLKPATGSDE